MKVLISAPALQRLNKTWLRTGEKVGLVPTMGALHEGHLTLIRRARQECAKVIVTIYVNPTQFGPKEDLAKYPRPREKDLALCRAAGADLVFAPHNLYLPDHSTYVIEETVSQGRDGTSRPGHFRGVATIVLKLFNLTQPTHAYFGQKDAQQVDVIRRMTRDLDVPVKIITVPTVRDKDGLALSSRNIYLSPEERSTAVQFAKLLQTAARKTLRPAAWLRQQLTKIPALKIDYIEITEGRLCAAIFVGKTRLIDNERLR